MIGTERVLAIVPARAGSKGLPGKNVRLLHGKPLLAWPILAARTPAVQLAQLNTGLTLSLADFIFV